MPKQTLINQSILVLSDTQEIELARSTRLAGLGQELSVIEYPNTDNPLTVGDVHLPGTTPFSVSIYQTQANRQRLSKVEKLQTEQMERNSLSSDTIAATASCLSSPQANISAARAIPVYAAA